MDRKNKINQIIRVDLAGEKGAIQIYKGQLALIKDENFSKEIELMLEKEKEHLETFKKAGSNSVGTRLLFYNSL